MLRLDDALALIDRRFAAVTAVETIPVTAAAGRILATPVVSPAPLPLADNAAMDGYALRAADTLAGPRPYQVAGRIAAGHPFAEVIGPGQAARIFTGALMPPGTDTVVKQELATVLDDGRVVLPGGVEPGANVRHRGEVLMPGAPVLSAGTILDPLRLGLLCDLGPAAVAVRVPLRIALISSGDELVPAGAPRAHHQVIDSNRPMLTGWLHRAGCHITQFPILRDDRAVMADALARAAGEHDLIITTAGMSVGEEDHVRAVLEDQGEVIFQRLAIKPGRPVGLGLLDGSPVLGLPGNPGAAALTFHLIGRHLLRILAGAIPRPPPRIPLPATFRFAKPAGDRVYLPARITAGGVERTARNAAGNLVWTAHSDGLVELAEAMEVVEPDTTVTFLPLDEAWP